MELDENAQALASITDKIYQFVKAQTQRPFIYKVQNPLRNIKPKAYEPEIIAIGPYHHGKKKLKMMEEHKVRYLISLLQRRNQKVEIYISTVGKLEQKARDCYAESIKYEPAKFIEMLVLDGCFIIELVLKWKEERSTQYNDPIFQTQWIKPSLIRDLILFENQIPFFVLCELLNLIVAPHEHNKFMDSLTNVFQEFYPIAKKGNRTTTSSKKVKHLLDLVHEIWRPSHDFNINENVLPNVFQKVKHLLHLLHSIWRPNPSNDRESNVDASHNSIRESRTIQCATALKDANVKFRKRESDSLFEVKFENGIIQMPPLTIEDGTECFFRNLIAYEQYFPENQRLFVTDYMVLMDCLINSSRDVGILSRRGIIVNLLGDDKVVAKMFNRLGDSVNYGGRFAYEETFRSINTHYEKPWNRAWAVLNRDYFNSPWAYISFFAALLLLLLTAAQTVFSAPQVFNPKHG